MAVGIDNRMRELCVHLRGAEMTIAGQRRREARGNNADLNFYCLLLPRLFRVFASFLSPAKTAKAGCRQMAEKLLGRPTIIN
jgi:hypothetical protein